MARSHDNVCIATSSAIFFVIPAKAGTQGGRGLHSLTLDRSRRAPTQTPCIFVKVAGQTVRPLVLETET